jgi:hypothetical protein
MSASESSQSSWLRAVCSALAATICVTAASYTVWVLLGSPKTGIDDANIFFVYARNIAHGHGIVYNVGGERVEGFTSMLYVLLCSMAFWVTRTPEAALFVMNLLFVGVTSTCLMLVLIEFAGALHPGRSGKLLLCGGYLIWLITNPAYFAWNVVTLMDSALYSLLLTAAYAFLALLLLRETQIKVRHALQLSILCSLCVLARPEGTGWALVQSAAFTCLCWAQTRSIKATARLAALPLGSSIFTLVALTGFRELYFGYPLPNTYYAKVTASALWTLKFGRDSLKFFVEQYGFFFLLPLFLGIVWIGSVLMRYKVRRKQTGRLFGFGALTALFAVTGLLIPVVEGGDHFGASRMFQNVYPLLGITLLLPLLRFPKAKKSSFIAIYLLCIGLLIGLTTKVTWRSFQIANQPGQINLPHWEITRRLDIHNDFSLAAGGQHLGQCMDRIFAEGKPSVGVSAAGGVAYTYQGTVYDLLGLNNSQMAHANRFKNGPKDHASFSKDVFYKLAPDILQPSVAPSGTPVDLPAHKALNEDLQNFDNQIFKDIFHDGQFRSMYVLALVRNPADPSEMVFGYFRKAYLADLRTKRGFELVSIATL